MEPSYQNIDRTAAILRVLGERNGAGARLTDVALSAKLSKSTAHRLIASLIGAGLVEQDETTRLFHLGFDLFVLGSKAANRYGLVEIADASLTNLVERTADTVYLERRQGAFPIKTLTLSIGDRRPLGIGAGSLAMLAALTDEDVALALDANAARLLPYRAFDASTIWELVEATRRNGYAWNDGRVVPGMHAIGISVLGTNGAPIGALSVAAIESRMIGERREHIVGWLRTEVTALEARLGRMTERLGDLGMRRLVGAN
jgi:DNA-binding IclR family transcriptional regulator